MISLELSYLLSTIWLAKLQIRAMLKYRTDWSVYYFQVRLLSPFNISQQT